MKTSPTPQPDERPAIAMGLEPAEANSLTRRMGAAVVLQIDFAVRRMGWRLDVATTEARTLTDDDLVRLSEAPPDQVSWTDLARLAEDQPDAMAMVWANLKTDALNELRSGHRAAEAVEWQENPRARARFLALRASLRAEWQPRGGIEDMLIDTVAQAQTMYLAWLGRLQVLTLSESELTEHQVRESGEWRPTRITTHEAIEQALAMVDRFNRMVLRTLRALRDQRRLGPVIVQHNAQVNIGAQQVIGSTVTKDAGTA